jgi:hypothetical protein
MSIFLVDVRQALASGLTMRPISNMVNHETHELFFDDLEIPVENRIGEEGRGFKYLLDGLNAERTLVAAECLGDAYWFIEKVSKYVNERIVFDRPIGQNQGVQFPIARAWVNLQAADLMRFHAAALFDAVAVRRRSEHGQAAGPPTYRGRPPSVCSSTAASALRRNTTWNASLGNPPLPVAPISTNMILAYGPNTCSICRVPSKVRSHENPAGRYRRSTPSAPFCTRQLADLGARVIKVERPGTGDFARAYDERVKGLASHFVWSNRSKESLTLDVKHPQAQTVLAHLLQGRRVVQNLAPGAAAAGRVASLPPAARPSCAYLGYGP